MIKDIHVHRALNKVRVLRFRDNLQRNKTKQHALYRQNSAFLSGNFPKIKMVSQELL